MTFNLQPGDELLYGTKRMPVRVERDPESNKLVGRPLDRNGHFGRHVSLQFFAADMVEDNDPQFGRGEVYKLYVPRFERAHA